jgi:hypothetical protein
LAQSETSASAPGAILLSEVEPAKLAAGQDATKLSQLKKHYAKEQVKADRIKQEHTAAQERLVCYADSGCAQEEAYGRVRLLVQIYPEVNFLALTATASPSTSRQISAALGFPDSTIHIHADIDRPNIYLKIIESADRQGDHSLQNVHAVMDKALSLINSAVTLVFARTQKLAKKLAGLL